METDMKEMTERLLNESEKVKNQVELREFLTEKFRLIDDIMKDIWNKLEDWRLI